MSFLLPTCGKPLDLSLLLPVMWPHPQPVQHNVRRFLKGGGAGALRQPSRCMGRSRMRAPAERRAVGCYEGSLVKAASHTEATARDKLSMGGPGGRVQTCRITSFSNWVSVKKQNNLEGL